MRINDFQLEIGTSSFTQSNFREKATLSSMLNNIFYSKLPDLLQSSISRKYLILTVNPIVDLYEDCKNTLSATLCKNVLQAQKDEEWNDWKNSPVKEEQLNEQAKKKLEGFERESEQYSLKIKRFEADCQYFKQKFEEL